MIAESSAIARDIGIEEGPPGTKGTVWFATTWRRGAATGTEGWGRLAGDEDVGAVACRTIEEDAEAAFCAGLRLGMSRTG